MRYFPLLPSIAAVAVAAPLAAAAEPVELSLADHLRALDKLRKGTETPFDQVDSVGAALLKEYDDPGDQAQIHFQLAHVHAQSGMRRLETIVEHATAALDSKLIKPDQRATLYSYLSSAHELNREIKDAGERRRKAVAPLLAGLAELNAFSLPEVAPEPPVVPRLVGDFADRAEGERARRIMAAAQAAREEAQRTRELVFRRDVLRSQVKFLYYRPPVADDELRELATEAIDEAAAEALVAAAQAEREKIEQAKEAAQRAREEKAAQEKQDDK